jgi:hypothetical protein
MTTLELAGAIGKRGTIRAGELAIEVEILNTKSSYGKVRYLVRPVAGSGETWTENVRLQEKA